MKRVTSQPDLTTPRVMKASTPEKGRTAVEYVVLLVLVELGVTVTMPMFSVTLPAIVRQMLTATLVCQLLILSAVRWNS